MCTPSFLFLHVPIGMNLRFGGRYLLGDKIGEGSFGEIFQGIDSITTEPIAIKIERTTAKFLQLEYEYRLYKILCPG